MHGTVASYRRRHSHDRRAAVRPLFPPAASASGPSRLIQFRQRSRDRARSRQSRRIRRRRTHAAARSALSNRCLYRSPLSGQSRRRMPARRSCGRGLDAVGRGGDESVRNRLRISARRWVPPALVHAGDRGPVMRSCDAGQRAHAVDDRTGRRTQSDKIQYPERSAERRAASHTPGDGFPDGHPQPRTSACGTVAGAGHRAAARSPAR